MVEETIIDIRTTTTTSAVSENTSGGEVVDTGVSGILGHHQQQEPHIYDNQQEYVNNGVVGTNSSAADGDDNNLLIFDVSSSEASVATASGGSLLLEHNKTGSGGASDITSAGNDSQNADELTNRLLILKGGGSSQPTSSTTTTAPAAGAATDTTLTTTDLARANISASVAASAATTASPQHYASSNSVKTSGSNSASNSPSRRHPGAIGTAERSSKTGLSLCLNPAIVTGNCSTSGSVVEGLSSAATTANNNTSTSTSSSAAAANNVISNSVSAAAAIGGSTFVAGNEQDNHLLQNSSASLAKSASLNLSKNNSATASNNSNIASTSTAAAAAAAPSSKSLGRSMNATLNEQEEQATREFLEIVNGARVSRGYSPLSWNAGVKFLMARKFNVRRALELYEQHQEVRSQEGLTAFDPDTEPLKSELLSGKFTVLPTRDLGGAAIAVFTAKLHQPSTVPHEFTLKGVVYQLDAALEDPQTQRCGLVFIYDMSDSKYSNFDYDLSIKILSLLKGGYPARLKKVLIVTAPLWFRAPFRILRLFVREKLRDRVFTVSLPQLAVHIPNHSLPRSLGGQLQVNHIAWLDRCRDILSSSDIWSVITDEPVQVQSKNTKDSGSSSKDDAESADKEVETLSNGMTRRMRRNGTDSRQSTPSPAPHSSGSSGFSDDDSLPFEERTGLTLLDFVEHLKQKGRRGLLDEYAEIVSKNPEGSFNVSRQRGNVNKNRYSDVLCFDHTRVVLSSEGESESDYINANFVDGYKQKNAFISTQGPLPRTFGDFWKMVWEQMSVVIVMTTRAVERGRTKCGQYWPPDKGSTVTHEGFKIENTDVEAQPDFALTRLRLTNTKTGDTRNVTHLQFLSWPDYGVPSSADAMLKFLKAMREEQTNRVGDLATCWDGHALGPPIVVHCSAGIGRTGTLCTIDICIRRLNDQGIVDVMGTVERIRSQRAYSIQVPEQYLFCHAAVIEYAKFKNLLSESQLDGIPDLLAEGDSDSE